jgi:hypothetical protein
VCLANWNLTKGGSRQGSFDAANAILGGGTVYAARQTTCLRDEVVMVMVVYKTKGGVGVGGANERGSLCLARQYRATEEVQTVELPARTNPKLVVDN